MPSDTPMSVAEEQTDVPKRGRLKIFLGYAAGVGKTYQMLTEARELKERGIDIVIAYFEPHGRKDTIALIEGLEVVPRKVVEYKGSLFEEMDTDAVLRRRPQVAVVDELPHTNVPGSPRDKRWEDVHVLLDAGIDVFTTMNVQHVESLNDQIWQSTGVRVRETVPDWVVKEADEVVMVDLTPRALLNRLERGVVYPPERARAALQNFFREPTLVALRELAMRQTAYTVESRHHFEDHAARRANRGHGSHNSARAAVAPDRTRSGKRRADSPRSPHGRLSASGLSRRLRFERSRSPPSERRRTRPPSATPQLCRGAADRSPRAGRRGSCGNARHVRSAAESDTDLHRSPEGTHVANVVHGRPCSADRQPRPRHAGHRRCRSLSMSSRVASPASSDLRTEGDNLLTA